MPAAGLSGDEESPRARLEGQDGSREGDADGEAGRTRASWASGHYINAGLPTRLPEWLHRVRLSNQHVGRVVRRGQPLGTVTGVDWSQTLRRWARQGHGDSALVWHRLPHGQGRVVVLWDVSGSMAHYVDWYFPWLYRLTNVSADVYVYAFGTGLENLTPYLKLPYRQAVAHLYREIGLWGSGTAIGQAFSEWLREDGKRLLGPWTTVVIISDGWDVGSPDVLTQAMRKMAADSRHILWMNPLMVTEGFEPRTRALRVALRYTRDMRAGATPAELKDVAWRLGFRA
ncbi:MAG: VWA domain-containing protein [Firmicutes bacterium]|nr:VWA domain-containing protein [Bacillota bacterium]